MFTNIEGTEKSMCQGIKEYPSLDEKTKDMIDAIIRIDGYILGGGRSHGGGHGD